MNAPRGRRPRRGGPGTHAEVEGILARLAEIGREIFLAKPHARDVVESIPELELKLRIGFSGRAEGHAARAAEVLQILDQHLDDAILARAAFRPGSVWSFFDRSADLPGCRPSDPREVFCGYTETGVCQWQPMLAWAIERDLDGLDALTAERGRCLVVSVGREELVGQRLPSFSENESAYDLRGQLVIGYYELGRGGGKFAVTLQIVRSTTRSGVVRLGLNTIGLLPDGRPARALIGEQGADYSFLDILHRADRRLATVNQELKRLPERRRAAMAADEAEALLADMGQGLSRHVRRHGWRTEHARERAESRERPTGMARGDVRTARRDRVLRDVREETLVVLGGRGRVHVFGWEGRHVTSLHIDRRSLDARLAQKRWVPLEKAEAAAALARVRAVFAEAGGDAEV